MQRSLASQTVESQRSTGLAVGQPAVFILSSDTDRTARLRERAQRRGCLVREASDVLTAMSVLDADSTIGVAFIDGDSAWFNGLQVIERLKRTHTRLSWVLVACEPHPEEVVRAMRLSVSDVLTMPEDPVQVDQVLGNAVEAFRTNTETDAPSSFAPPLTGAPTTIEQVSRQCLALVESVWTLCEQVSNEQGKPAAPTLTPPPHPAGDMLSTLMVIQRRRQARERFFPKGLFEDPCWDMLLDLMINHLQGRRISVSSLCIASGVAQTTALRRITDLHRRGLVHRSADDKDGRRVFIELTETGLAAMNHYVESVGPLG